MNTFLLYIALGVNVLVAGFWGVVLSFRVLTQLATNTYGADSPARRILGCLYASIALCSVTALLLPHLTVAIAMVLFPLQILYKLLTLPVVGSWRHPVVLSNLLITALLGAALFTMLR
jgi:hypothetical protein